MPFPFLLRQPYHRQWFIPLLLMSLPLTGCIVTSPTIEETSEHPLIIARPEIDIKTEQSSVTLSDSYASPKNGIVSEQNITEDEGFYTHIEPSDDSSVLLERIEPAVEMIDAQTEGYSVMLPDQFTFRQSERSLIMEKDRTEGGANFLLKVYPLERENNPEAFLEAFMTNFSSTLVESSDIETVEINGAVGLKRDIIMVPQSGVVLYGTVVGLQRGNTTALIFGSSNSSLWQVEYEAQFDEVLATVELHPLPDNTVAFLTR